MHIKINFNRNKTVCILYQNGLFAGNACKNRFKNRQNSRCKSLSLSPSTATTIYWPLPMVSTALYPTLPITLTHFPIAIMNIYKSDCFLPSFEWVDLPACEPLGRCCWWKPFWIRQQPVLQQKPHLATAAQSLDTHLDGT